jgi:tetratricopeptide (TPR) repeat protein
MGRNRSSLWAAVVIAAGVPLVAWAEDVPLREQALRLNDVTGNAAISGKIRELLKDKPAAKKLVAEAAEMAKDKDQPFNYNGAFILAQLARRTKDADHSVTLIKVCADQAKKLHSSKKLVEATDALIVLLNEQNKSADVVQVCREFLDFPGGKEVQEAKPFVMEQMILALSKSGKTDEALKHTDTLVKADDGGWYFVRLKAEVLAEDGKYSDAVANYEEAVSRIQELKNKDDQVDKEKQQAFQGRCRLSMQRLVVDFIRRDKHDAALKLLDELTKADVFFAGMKGEVLRDQGKLDEAAPALESAVGQLDKSSKLDDKIKKALVDRCRYVMSGVYTDLNQIEKAAGELQTLLKANPENSTYNNDLGYIWADHDMNLEESEKLIRKALDLDKSERAKIREAAGTDADDDRANPAYLDSLGWVLFKKKQFEEAKKYLIEASQQEDGQHVEILDHLAQVHMALGEKAQAIAVWKKALEVENITKRDNARKEVVRKKLEKEQSDTP